MDDLKAILERIRKPLAFASRDGFAHLGSLAALEPFMVKQVQDLKAITKGNRLVPELEKLFAGFDSLSLKEKKERIKEASKVMDLLGQEQEHAPSVRNCPSPQPSPSKGEEEEGEAEWKGISFFEKD